MTLILTLVRPGEGVWQTIDARLTAGGRWRANFADKQVFLDCLDGKLLIGYTGLAEIGIPAVSTFDYIRHALSGRVRTVMDSLVHLRDCLTEGLARSRHRDQIIHIFVAGIYGYRNTVFEKLREAKTAVWLITNGEVDAGPTPTLRAASEFSIECEPIEKADYFAIGSVAPLVHKNERALELLERARQYRPNKSLDYVGLLARVNRIMAKDSRGTVSPWCVGAHLSSRTGDLPSLTLFSEDGDPQRTKQYGLPTIIFGLDLTDSTRWQMDFLMAQRRQPPEH